MHLLIAGVQWTHVAPDAQTPPNSHAFPRLPNDFQFSSTFFFCCLCADLLQVVALAVKLRKLQADTVVHSRKSINRNSTLCGPYARDGWLLLALPVAAAMAITQVYDSLNLYVAVT